MEVFTYPRQNAARYGYADITSLSGKIVKRLIACLLLLGALSRSTHAQDGVATCRRGMRP